MPLLYLLTAIISGAYVLLMLSYLYAWFKTPARQFKPAADNLQPVTRVSIIIPARNEENNILNCLSAIYKQTYPSALFEVIVVDDHSADRTRERVELEKYPYLKLIRLSESLQGKKQALAEGVKKASGTLIVTTDADCTMGENWLSSIVSFYEEKKPKMILGPVLLKNETGFQQIMQAQEMTVLTACACASVSSGMPILCSGANLIYEKEVFFEVNGFDGVDKTASGDDMFLMLKVHSKFPDAISYLRSREAIVFTDPEKLSSSALKQRKRWASKTFLYGFSHVTGVAMLIFFTNFLIVFSGIMSAINLKFALIPIVCFSAKFLVDFMLLYSAASFFGKKTHPFVFVMASVLYPVYVSVMGLVSPFSSYDWKSRKS